ncbi:MAG: type II toxin-antitoxin system VapB family antitoxin [Proteobacteria bacterium]|nr:type II toxin-antitoxin system VapB family antitoxin [Pseudomonadota bacterium]
MRATLNIPDDLIVEVQNLSGEKSKTKAIVTAMQEYIKERKIKKLLELRGRFQIDYNWQKEEEIELQAQKEREKLLER